MQIKKYYSFIRLFSMMLILLSVTACFIFPAAHKFDTSAFLKLQTNQIDKSAQIILAVDDSSFFFTRTTLYAMEKREDTWQMAFKPFNIVRGKGFAPSWRKKRRQWLKRLPASIPLK